MGELGEEVLRRLSTFFFPKQLEHIPKAFRMRHTLSLFLMQFLLRNVRSVQEINNLVILSHHMGITSTWNVLLLASVFG